MNRGDRRHLMRVIALGRDAVANGDPDTQDRFLRATDRMMADPMFRYIVTSEEEIDDESDI